MSRHRFFYAILIASLLVEGAGADRLELVRYTDLWTQSLADHRFGDQ